MMNSFTDKCFGIVHQPCRNIRPPVRRTKLQRTSKFQIEKDEKLCLGVRITKKQECFKKERVVRSVTCCLISLCVCFPPQSYCSEFPESLLKVAGINHSE